MRNIYKVIGFLVEYLIVKPVLYLVLVPFLFSIIMLFYSLPIAGLALAFDQLKDHARKHDYNRREHLGAQTLVALIQVPWSYFFVRHIVWPLGVHWGLWS